MRFPVEVGAQIPADNPFSAEFQRWDNYNGKASVKLIGGSCTQIGNKTVGGKDLHVYTIKAGLLLDAGASVYFHSVGLCAANGNSKTVALNAGGTDLYSSGAIAMNNKPYELHGRLISTGPKTQISIVSGFVNNAVVPPTILTNLTLDNTKDIVIKSTGTNDATANNDIIEYFASLFLMQGLVNGR